MSPRPARTTAIPTPVAAAVPQVGNVVWLFPPRPVPALRGSAFTLLAVISLGFWVSAGHFAGLY